MSSGSEEFQDALSKIEEGYRDGLRAFVKYLQASWRMTPEEWAAAYTEPAPSADWFSGHRAAIDSLEDGLELFLEGYGP